MEEQVSRIGFDYNLPSKILDRLYLSSIVPTCEEDIKTHRITAVLSVLSQKPADFVHCEGVQYHLVQLDDDENADLLSHLERTSLLLEEWLHQCGHTVLVHCLMGVSRSSSVIIAYLMRHLQISFDEALKMVLQERPVAAPNRGFVQQLRLWGQLKCRISQDDELYRRYFFLTIFNLMQSGSSFQRGEELKERISELVRADKEVTNVLEYRCRRCRFQLFTDIQLLHTDSHAYYAHILSWMNTDEYLKQSGKITCPKCAGKLGRYSWSPPLLKGVLISQSDCDLQVPMVFQMTKSAIDDARSVLAFRSPPKNKVDNSC